MVFEAGHLVAVGIGLKTGPGRLAVLGGLRPIRLLLGGCEGARRDEHAVSQAEDYGPMVCIHKGMRHLADCLLKPLIGLLRRSLNWNSAPAARLRAVSLGWACP